MHSLVYAPSILHGYIKSCMCTHMKIEMKLFSSTKKTNVKTEKYKEVHGIVYLYEM